MNKQVEQIKAEIERWKKEQMMKDAVDAEVVYMIGEGTLFNPEVLPDNIKPGDKVKLIIVKED